MLAATRAHSKMLTRRTLNALLEKTCSRVKYEMDMHFLGHIEEKVWVQVLGMGWKYEPLCMTLNAC